MGIFKNREVRSAVRVLAVGCLVAALGGLLFSPAVAVYVLFLGGVCVAGFCLFLQRRQRRIAALAADIDRILHGADSVNFEEYEEGELQKMTRMLREQRDTLLSDKTYLADAMADLSHQIRTPLTSMTLIASLLASPKVSEQERSAYIRDLDAMLARMDWQLTALLKLSKLDAGTVRMLCKPMPVAQLLQSACEPLLIPIELRGQTLHQDVEEGATLCCDEAWTAEAIGNIVKNCMEHTPEGGRLCITANETALFTEIRITDTGSGISPEDLPHIFERFYKGADSSAKSFGIGLALARMIFTQQNATIKASNARTGGAVFEIRFYKENV